MRSNRDSDTNMLTLFDFIQDLLDTANSCLGGVNKLAMRIEDDSTLRIYDQNMIYGGNPEEEKEEIEPIINLGIWLHIWVKEIQNLLKVVL